MKTGITKSVVLTVVLVIIFGLALSCAPQPSQVPQAPQAPKAQTTDEFYQGKVITIIVASAPGGGEDLLARLIATFIGKQMGCGTAVVNKPAGGGMEGINYVYGDTKPDGLTMLITTFSKVLPEQVQKNPAAKYDTAKLQWLAFINPISTMLTISPKSPYLVRGDPLKTIENLKKAKGVTGAGHGLGSVTMNLMWEIDMLGLDAKVITGYKGTSETSLALGKGEADLASYGDSTTKMYADAGFVVPILTCSATPSPLFPDLPLISKVAVKPLEGDILTKLVWSEGGKAAAFGPNVLQDKVTYLRDVFKKLEQDKEVQTVLEKALGEFRPWVSVEKMESYIKDVIADKDLQAKLVALIAKYRKD